MGGASRKTDPPPPVRLCPNCKFPVTGNGRYCHLCATINAHWKDNPKRQAEELAEVKRRRESGEVRKGHGFQKGQGKQGRPTHYFNKDGKAFSRSAMGWDRHREVKEQLFVGNAVNPLFQEGR